MSVDAFVYVNRSNLKECDKIVRSSRKRISSILNENIEKLNNSITNNSYFYNVRNIDMSEAKDLLKLTKNDLNEVIEDMRKTLCLIDDIDLAYSKIEKNTNKQIAISEELYNNTIANFKKKYNINDERNSILTGNPASKIASAVASITSASTASTIKPGINPETDYRYKPSDKSNSTNNGTAGVSKTIAEALRGKSNSSSKEKKKTDTNTNTNSTTSGTKSTTTNNNYNNTRTNSTVTTSGIGAIPAVTAASTNATAKLVATNGKTTKVKKQILVDDITNKRKKQSLIDDITNKRKKEVVPNDIKPFTPKDKPTTNTKPKVPNNNDNNTNNIIKPDTPPTDQTSNTQPDTPPTTENQETPIQENKPQVATNQNNGESKRSFVTNANKNNPVVKNEVTNQTPNTDTNSPSPSLSDNINNDNTTNLFDTDVDDFSDIEDSLSSVGSNSKTGGSGVIPVVAGLGAATAVGIGAKVYKDRKDNNDLDLNEDRPSNENKFWTTDDSMVIHSEKEEYDINSDYPTTEEPSSYTAIDNSIEEVEKDTWEMPEENNGNQIIDLLGNE